MTLEISHLISAFCLLHSLINSVIYTDSRARLVAGSFQGHTGHVDGKPSDARFNHPKGVTMDDKGNVYVADTLNLAIRKIGETGLCYANEISQFSNAVACRI